MAAAGLRDGQLCSGGLNGSCADPETAAKLKGQGCDGPRRPKMGLMGRLCGTSPELLKQSRVTGPVDKFRHQTIGGSWAFLIPCNPECLWFSVILSVPGWKESVGLFPALSAGPRLSAFDTEPQLYIETSLKLPILHLT